MTKGPLQKLRDFVLNRAFLHKSGRKKYSRQSEQLMLLVREMIDMAYMYEGDSDKFYRKFVEKISVESLRKSGVIDPEILLHAHRNHTGRELKIEDAELLALLKVGFSTRGLMMVYGHTNINSVYVKVNRLRKRLNRRMRELIDSR